MKIKEDKYGIESCIDQIQNEPAEIAIEQINYLIESEVKKWKKRAGRNANGYVIGYQKGYEKGKIAGQNLSMSNSRENSLGIISKRTKAFNTKSSPDISQNNSIPQKQVQKKDLKEMYDKLSDMDKFRVNHYIWQNVHFPIIKQSLIDAGLFDKENISQSKGVIIKGDADAQSEIEDELNKDYASDEGHAK